MFPFFLLLFVPIVFGSLPKGAEVFIAPFKCDQFFASYKGRFQYVSSGPTARGPSGPELSMELMFEYTVVTEVRTMKKMEVVLIKKDFKDKKYKVEFMFEDDTNTIYKEKMNCRGFTDDTPGREGGLCWFSVPAEKQLTYFTFQLCLEEDKCEVFFEAEISASNVLHPVLKNEDWSDGKCYQSIVFKGGYQPPSPMRYCMCCNRPGPSQCENIKEPLPSDPGDEPPINVPPPMPDGTLRKIDCEHQSGDPIEREFCDNTTVTPENVGQRIAQTRNGIDVEKTDATDVYMLSHIMYRITRVKTEKYEDYAEFHKLSDKILGIPRALFQKANGADHQASQRFIKFFMFTFCRILDGLNFFVKNAKFDLNFLDGENLAIRKHQTALFCKNEEPVRLSDCGSTFDWGNTTAECSSPNAFIEIPRSIICKEGAESIPLYIIAYRKTPLFVRNLGKEENMDKEETPPTADLFAATDDDVRRESIEEDRCRKGMFTEGRPVLSAVLEGQTDSSSSGGVLAKIRYTTDRQREPLHGLWAVSWWNGKDWSSDGQCQTTYESDGVVAECRHLTDFTLLVDGCVTDPILCDTTLTLLGNILVLGSAICLFVLLIIQLLNLTPQTRHLKFFVSFPSLRFRVELVSFVYTTTLFLFYLVFGLFGDRVLFLDRTGCSVFAGISYFLLLCCICLTIFQAWRVLKLFAWSSRMDKLLGFVSHDVVILISSILLPLVLSLTAFFIDPMFYQREDDFCWIRPTDTVWGVIVPISVLVGNGVVCLVVIVFRLYPDARCLGPVRRLFRQNTNLMAAGRRETARDRFITLLNIQFLLGMPWAFQYLTLFAPQTNIWHYLFTIVNGSQGIVLFALFVYRRYRAHRRRGLYDPSASGSAQTQSRTLTSEPSKGPNSPQSPMRYRPDGVPIGPIFDTSTLSSKSSPLSPNYILPTAPKGQWSPPPSLPPHPSPTAPSRSGRSSPKLQWSRATSPPSTPTATWSPPPSLPQRRLRRLDPNE